MQPKAETRKVQPHRKKPKKITKAHTALIMKMYNYASCFPCISLRPLYLKWPCNVQRGRKPPDRNVERAVTLSLSVHRFVFGFAFFFCCFFYIALPPKKDRKLWVLVFVGDVMWKVTSLATPLHLRPLASTSSLGPQFTFGPACLW